MMDNNHNNGTDQGLLKLRHPGKRANHNAMRHGLKAGRLPKDCKFIEVRLNVFRRAIEAAVLRVKSVISEADACSINTAIRWERHACLAQRWLTQEYAKLKPEQRLHFSREIAKASTERDKAVRELRTDSIAAADMVIDQLYANTRLAHVRNEEPAK